MNRAILILSLFLFLKPMAWAGELLSASSRFMLFSKSELRNRGIPESPSHDLHAFIAFGSQGVIDSLKAAGVEVNAVFDGFLTASFPEETLNEVSRISGVSHIALERHVTLCNDSARYYSHVDDILQAKGLAAPLRGEGIIVGMIDTGFDFNHVNWRGQDGTSRVRAVYMPCDSTGRSPVVDDCTLPGSCYETAQEISLLTTDNVGSSHGTHTTGTAAGSYMSNGLYGVAPAADIVVCGMPENELTDVNIANGVRYIFDYADRVGKPCVINMSLGSNDGPNDGSSFLCRTFSSLSGPGHICVLSAGNDGDAPICFHRNLTGKRDTVTTLLRNRWGGMQREGYVSMWNDGPQEHLSRIVIINRQTSEMVYASPWIGALPEDSVFTVSSENDLRFGDYYTGEFQYVNAVEPQFNADGTESENGRFHSYWIFDATSLVSGFLVGIQYMANQPTSLSGWSTKNTYFYTFNLPGMTGGSPVGSISDMATTDDVISVGAYCTRASYISMSGDPVVINGSYPTDIATFSSFGPDERGISRPDVCAPGYSVISSANRYESDAVQRTWTIPATVDGIEYPYYVNQGTSMSAPVVTGCVALMLQLHPQLNANMVRDVLKATSKRDSYVIDGNPEQWGCGKLDVQAAVNHVIDNYLLKGDANTDQEVNIADVMIVIDIILGSSMYRDAATMIRADVNRDGEIQLGDVNSVIELILKN